MDRRKRKRLAVSMSCAAAAAVEQLISCASDSFAVKTQSSLPSLFSRYEEDEDHGLHALFLQTILHCATLPTHIEGGWWVKPRNLVWFHRFIMEVYEDERWKLLFKVSRESFFWICQQIERNLTKQVTNFRHPIPVHFKVGATLFRLTKGADLVEVSDKFGIGVSSSHSCIKETVKAINSCLGNYLRWPDEPEVCDVINGFCSGYGFSNCVGVIGSTYIPVLPPPIGASTDHNRKPDHVVCLQTVCDASHKILDAFACYTGCMQYDTEIFRKSPLYMKAENGEILDGDHHILNDGYPVRQYIIGGVQFPLLPWLIVPYSGRSLSVLKSIYNERHLQVSSIVEETFAVLKNTFRILSTRVNHKVHFIPELIRACCILHNILIDRKDILVDKMLHEIGVNMHAIFLEHVVDGEAQLEDDIGAELRSEITSHLLGTMDG